MKTSRRPRLNLWWTAIAAVAVLATPAAAQPAASAPAQPPAAASTENNGEIVVVAQRRAERQLDVPITVTTLSEQQLQTANVQTLGDIARVTPALRFDRQAAFVQPTIRGIGTSITTTGGGSNVGIYVDGFYSPNPTAADFELLNVNSIQVLKGPQGTLFGRNTTGGAILVQTSDPSTDAHGEVRASYARFNEWRAQGYATWGLSANDAVDFEGLYTNGDGWVRNLSTGRTDGDFENWSFRLGYKHDFNEAVSALFHWQHSETDDQRSLLTNAYVDNTDVNRYLPHPQYPIQAPLGATIFTGAPANTFTSNPSSYNSGANARFVKSISDVLQLTVRADLGFADLTSYTQYRTENLDQSEDLDQIGLTIFQIGIPVRDETTSQEFLLTSKPGTRLQWTTGLFYFENTDRYLTYIDNFLSTAGTRIRLGGSSAPTYSTAVFADLTYELTPQWFITGGLRYAHDTVQHAYYNPTLAGGQCNGVPPAVVATKCFVPDLDEDNTIGRLVVRYKPNETSSIYASYTQGYKAGILDVGGATGRPVRPEHVNAYEIGYKYDNHRLSFETAAYYYDYRDLQVSLFFAGTAKIINAASSTISGIEAQLRYDVTDNFEINFGANWNHARYDKFEHAPIYLRCPAPINPPGTCVGGQSFYITGVDVGGDVTLHNVHMQRAPDTTANLGARYTTGLEGGQLALSGNAYYTSKFFFAPSGVQFPQGSYTTLSLRAEWTDPSDRYSLAVFGDNVTDERYITQVQYNNFGIGSTWSDPAIWGLEVSARY